MTNDILYMISRFPVFQDTIVNAYETNKEFRSMCQDFYLSALILKTSRHKVLQERKSDLEYQKLFLDLESEILEFLDAGERH